MPDETAEFMDWLKKIPETKQDEFVDHVITGYFKRKGKLAMFIIVGLGIFLTAVVGIFGSLKAILAWFGWSIMKS